jgi:hypothetical protein
MNMVRCQVCTQIEKIKKLLVLKFENLKKQKVEMQGYKT